MVRLTDRPAMTIAVDLGRKATKPTNYLLLTLMKDSYRSPQQMFTWRIMKYMFIIGLDKQNF